MWLILFLNGLSGIIFREKYLSLWIRGYHKGIFSVAGRWCCISHCNDSMVSLCFAVLTNTDRWSKPIHWPQSPWSGKAFGSIPGDGSSEAECSWHGSGIRKTGKGKGSAGLSNGCVFSLNLEIFWCGFWGFFCLVMIFPVICICGFVKVQLIVFTRGPPFPCFPWLLWWCPLQTQAGLGRLRQGLWEGTALSVTGRSLELKGEQEVRTAPHIPSQPLYARWVYFPPFFCHAKFTSFSSV